MCDFENEIKLILTAFPDVEAIERIRIETLKEDLIETLKDDSFGVSLDDLGLTLNDVDNTDFMYEVTEVDCELNESVKMAKAKITNLYRYVSLNTAKSKSRRFCKELTNRTELSMMRYVDILRLNGKQKGMGLNGANVYSVFKWRGGVNCQHIWVKYAYNSETKKLIKAPINEQPIQTGKGRVPNA